MSTIPRSSPATCAGRSWFTNTFFLLALAGAVACGRGEGAAGQGSGPPAGGMPPMPVGVLAVEARAVEQATEFIGTIKSRRSTTIQPQVEGFITRIVATPGQRVQPGALLMEIDAAGQTAAVASLDSQRAAREADLQYARQQAQRLKTLFDAGAVSQQEYEQAQTALSSGEAQVKAIEAQIREQRVELAYHRVTAPTVGVVGDIPVRVGDRVTTSTTLTTVDANAGLEVYLNVPVQQAPGLKVGLPVRLVDERGETIQMTEISFVSPHVDEGVQAVLAKAALKDPTGFRTDQFVRVRVVWSTAPTITVPLVAVNRISGQYFAFVAEAGDGGTFARQRAVNVGPIVGNDYVVLSGLKAGEQLIVSGIQKITDGAPVQIGPPAAAPGSAPAAGGEGK